MARPLVVWALLVGGCVITDPVELEEPYNAPPSIRTTTDSDVSMNRIITQVYDEAGELVIPIIVRDENLYDDLVMQVWVDFVPVQDSNNFTGSAIFLDPLEQNALIEATGEPDRAPRAIIIDHELLAQRPSCHRIEILVTRAFRATIPPHRVPETPGDIGSAVFWVAMQEFAGDDVGMSTCP